MNIVNLSGRLGSDIKVYGNENRMFGRIRVAIERFKKTADGKREKTNPVWATVFINGRRSIALQPYLKKGTKISVTGRLSMDTKGNLVVIGDRIEFLNTPNTVKPTVKPEEKPEEVTVQEPF